MNNVWPAVWMVISGVTVGCATPAPLVRLHPRAEQITWVAGRAVTTQANTGIRVAAAFEQQDGSALGIRVEVENQTDRPFDVDPRDLTFVTCTSEKVASCAPARRVVDPEVMLDAVQATASIEAASASNEQQMLVGLFLLSAATDVAAASSGQGHPHGAVNTIAIANDFANDFERSEARYQTRAGSLAEQRHVWSNVALRRNTLAPGQGTSGLVYVPIDLSAKYVWLQVRADARTFPFCFAQEVIRLSFPPPDRASHSGAYSSF